MSLTVLAGYGLEDRRRSGHMRVEVGGTCQLVGRHVRCAILSNSENQWPPGSVSPSFKVQWARGSRPLHWSRGIVLQDCAVCEAQTYLQGMWNGTQPFKFYKSILELSLSHPLDFLEQPSYCSILSVLPWLFQGRKGHCYGGQMMFMDSSAQVIFDRLLATLRINNRKAQQLVTHQNPFPGLRFCSCKLSQPAGVWLPEEMLGNKIVRRDTQMGQGQCRGSMIWGYGAFSWMPVLSTSWKRSKVLCCFSYLRSSFREQADKYKGTAEKKPQTFGAIWYLNFHWSQWDMILYNPFIFWAWESLHRVIMLLEVESKPKPIVFIPFFERWKENNNF